MRKDSRKDSRENTPETPVFWELRVYQEGAVKRQHRLWCAQDSRLSITGKMAFIDLQIQMQKTYVYLGEQFKAEKKKRETQRRNLKKV